MYYVLEELKLRKLLILKGVGGFFAGNVKQPQQFLLGSNVVAYERKKIEKNATQELNKDSFNHNKCVNKGMLW